MDQKLAKSAADYLLEKPAGWLFAHLAYWAPKAKTKRHGKCWVVRPYDEMRDKFGCMYSERSMKRAVKRLRDEGLIEVLMTPNPFRSGQMRVRWFAITGIMKDKIDQLSGEEST